MASQEMLDFFAEQGKRDYERWRSTHNKPEPSEWIQVTQDDLSRQRTAIVVADLKAVVQTRTGATLYVQPDGGRVNTVCCIETYDEIMSQLGVKPIERKEVES